MLSRESKIFLLKLARDTIYSYVREGVLPPVPQVNDPQLLEKRGAFVTLKIKERLRGCIGTFVADTPLMEVVIDMAKAAATEDPRFAPVMPEELDQISIEISVLSPLRKISDINEIEVGKHGIYIKRPPYRGVLLPQVAVEWGWDLMEFLDQTCFKAGLPEGCWKDPDTTVEIFEAEVFDEYELGLRERPLY